EPTAELEGGGELGGLRGPDARQLGKLDLARTGKAGQPVVPGQRLRREVERRKAARARSPEQRDELCRRQPTGPAQRQSLSRALGGGHLAQRTTRHTTSAEHASLGPRTRLTEARRFLPPTGSRGRQE